MIAGQESKNRRMDDRRDASSRRDDDRRIGIGRRTRNRRLTEVLISGNRRGMPDRRMGFLRRAAIDRRMWERRIDERREVLKSPNGAARTARA